MRGATRAAMPRHRRPERPAQPIDAEPGGRLFVLAGLQLAAFVGTLSLLAVRDPVPEWPQLPQLDVRLLTACAVVAAAGGFVSCLRWRMVGDASSVRAGAALVVLGVAFATESLWPSLNSSGGDSLVLDRTYAALVLTAVVLLVMALAGPRVSTHVTAPRLILGVAAGVVVLVPLQALIPLLTDLGSSGRVPLQDSGDFAVRAGVVFAYVSLGAVSGVRGLRERSWLFTWLGLMLLAFAYAYLLNAFATVPHDLWVTGSLVLRVVGLLFFLIGVSQELKRAYVAQRLWLVDTQAKVAATEARRRAERAAAEERAHEARSAVLAIQSATERLATGYDDVAPEHRESLRVAVQVEIELLRQLVETEERGSEVVPFDVASVVVPVVTAHRAAGLDVTGPRSGAIAVGRPSELAEVVQALLDNAAVHAPGSAVTVTVTQDTERVLVLVDDEGPGVDPSRRERIFHRAVSGAVDHCGLGLFVGRRLVRARGGDLWVEDRVGGGARFVVALPVAPSLADVSPLWGTGTDSRHDVDHVDDGAETYVHRAASADH